MGASCFSIALLRAGAERLGVRKAASRTDRRVLPALPGPSLGLRLSLKPQHCHPHSLSRNLRLGV